MPIEVPQFKSCCFCLPIRDGLLIWGYLKMTADLTVIPPLSYFTSLFLMVILAFHNFELFAYAFVMLIILITIIVNFVATLVFVIGCHKKKVKKIKGFYTYSIWELRLMTLLIMVVVGITIRYWRADATREHLVIFTIYLLTLALHAYFILLLRSEIIKLDASIANNSAEANTPCVKKEEAIECV